MKIKIIRFKQNIILPVRNYYNDAGADVFNLTSIEIPAHTTVKVPLGFGLNIPDGFMACIFPRSSLSSKGIITHIPPIDSGYSGEIHAIITNNNTYNITLNKDDKIGQLVIIPIVLCDFVDTLGDERGDNGFGSTNKRK